MAKKTIDEQIEAAKRRKKSYAQHVGGHTRALGCDYSVLGALGQAASWAKYLDLVDPDRVLPEKKRVELAEHVRKARMYRGRMKAEDTKIEHLNRRRGQLGGDAV